MSFRHYTKLKEIAKKYGCDSSGCDSNGDLIDRLYETPITPVDPDPDQPTGTVDAKIDIQNITGRFVRPVEGHSYLGIVPNLSADTWILELDGVVGYKEESKFFYPVGSMCTTSNQTCFMFFNDVENTLSGNIAICGADADSGAFLGFSDEQIENFRSEIQTNGSIVFTVGEMSAISKLTITNIAE